MPRFIDTDRIPLSCHDLPDGSMVATGTLASVGVMAYPWGAEAVGEDCLSDPEWIATAHSPITLEHPPGAGAEKLLDPAKVERYSSPDYTGPGKIIPGAVRVWWDGGSSANKIEVRVFNEDVAEGIRRGMYELSPGYLTPEVDNEPGEMDGRPYDTRQRKRVGNHVALILAKQFGGRGGRGAAARFDAGESRVEASMEASMDEAQVKAMIAEALAAYKAEDEAKDVEQIDARIRDALADMKDNGGMDERMAKIDARLDAYDAANKPANKPAEEAKADKPEAKPEQAAEEARADAADDVAVQRLAGSRGMDINQPVATLRSALLSGTGYEQKARNIQRVYVGELAKHVRTDAADQFGFNPMPFLQHMEPSKLMDRSTRLADKGKK